MKIKEIVKIVRGLADTPIMKMKEVRFIQVETSPKGKEKLAEEFEKQQEKDGSIYKVGGYDESNKAFVHILHEKSRGELKIDIVPSCEREIFIIKILKFIDYGGIDYGESKVGEG